MKKLCFRLMFSTIAIFVLAAPAFAFDLEAILPFSSGEVDNYYVRYQIGVDHLQDIGDDYPIQDVEHLEYRVYYKDGVMTSFTTVPLHDGTMHEYQFTFEYGDSWMPKPAPSLFFSNYELHVKDLAEVAGREAVVIDVISKHTKNKVTTYVIDLETSMVLNQFQYDSSGSFITQWQKTLEIDYDPDFSGVNFDDPFKVNLESSLGELTKEQVLEFLPWLNLEDLSLPQGYEIVSFTHAETGVLRLEESYLRNKYPEASTMNIYIWISDGLDAGEIRIAFVDDQKQGSTYSIEVLETSPETYVAIEVLEADTVLSFSVVADELTPEEQIALLKSFVPQD